MRRGVSWDVAGGRMGTVSGAYGSPCIKSIPLESLFYLRLSPLSRVYANCVHSRGYTLTREPSFDLSFIWIREYPSSCEVWAVRMAPNRLKPMRSCLSPNMKYVSVPVFSRAQGRTRS
jgi:hypothetical protein